MTSAVLTQVPGVFEYYRICFANLQTARTKALEINPTHRRVGSSFLGSAGVWPEHVEQMRTVPAKA